MSLGVHFALSPSDIEQVRAIDDPDDLVEFLTEEIEERYLSEREWAYSSDKAWDAIHRCLADGKLLYGTGPVPLRYAVLGGEALDVGDDYTACFVTPEQVRETSLALAEISHDSMATRYATLANTDYASFGPADFEYMWQWFEGLPGFFAKAARAGRAVLFTTDC